jgi:putative DNA primase/helicase
MNDVFELRVRDIKARAHGHWTSILKALGVDERILNGKNQPCPLPECVHCTRNQDRFQYTDKFGEGNYHCRKCGAGGGIKLAQGALGLRFGELLDRIERLLGTARVVAGTPATGPSPERMKQLCRGIWHEAVPVTAGDEVDRYLRNRGLRLDAYPRALRLHPALGYFEKPAGQRSRKVAEYPAMLACVQGPDGHAVTLHRTYLKDGRKAVGPQSKKVLSAGINGAAVRLFEPTDELAITEGIETALAVHLRTGAPAWAALSCGNLEKLWIPDSVRRVRIYADNDSNTEFDGQAAAFGLARRLKRDAKGAPEGSQAREVDVFIPKQAGADWADIWLARLSELKRAA